MKRFSMTVNVLILLVLCFSVFSSYGIAAGSTKHVPRNFMLVLDLKHYSPKVKDAVSYFFEHLFLKGDQLVIATPKRLLGFSPRRLALPREELVKYVTKHLK